MNARATSAALAFVCLAATADAQADPDPWLGRDKAAHFSVSMGIAAGSYGLSTTFLDARGHALLLAGGVTLAIGAGKELVDLAGFGDPSWKDFTWDVIGAVTGLLIAWSVDLAVGGVGDRHPLLTLPHTTATRSLRVSF